MKLKANILKKIKSDKYLKARLTVPCGCSIFTIERWCNPKYRPKSDMPSPLLSAGALKVIREELGLTDDQILEDVKQSAA